jgi:excinuclease ABC subunit C
MRVSIAEKLSKLPASPGVYLMKDGRGEVFYIGKAMSLRDRVRSYFSGSDTRAFVARLDEILFDLEVILTANETEALIVENDLIKRMKPRFNVVWVDDKNFLRLRLEMRQAYPRLEVVRRFKKDGARYFGPFASASALRETLRLINRHFQLRTCSDAVMRQRTRPCIQYQIRRCPAPCVFDLSQGAYAQNARAVVAFLEGRGAELVNDLTGRMTQAADALEFERAAQLRDQIRAVERSLTRQLVSSPEMVSRDVVGIYRQGPAVEIHLMITRQGRMVGASRFSIADTDLATGDILSDFAMRYYSDPANDVPREILFPEQMEWAAPLETYLRAERQSVVEVLVPQRGDKHSLVKLANSNAHQAFVDKARERGAARTAIEHLRLRARLVREPKRIECFDISHLSGTEIVASSVRFENGLPQKSLYRHYRIRTLTQQDDFQSMYEVVSRRARRGLLEGDLPDLFVIDGGKGQLTAARAALDDHGIDRIDVLALAKEKSAPRAVGDFATGSRAKTVKPERIFVLGQREPIVLRHDSAEQFLLTRVRDEAHRFAITFQRRRRQKAFVRSALDEIAGVGPARRKALLTQFGSVRAVMTASLDELANVVGPAVSRRVFATLHGKETTA